MSEKQLEVEILKVFPSGWTAEVRELRGLLSMVLPFDVKWRVIGKDKLVMVGYTQNLGRWSESMLAEMRQAVESGTLDKYELE